MQNCSSIVTYIDVIQKKLNDQFCYQPYYTTTSQDSLYSSYNFNSPSVQDLISKMDISKLFVRTVGTTNSNLITKQQDFTNFYTKIVNTLTDSTIVDANPEFNYDANLGTYVGSGQSFYVPIADMNYETWLKVCSILEINKDFYLTGGLRGLSLSFTFYQYDNNMYYYVILFFEFPSANLMLTPQFEIFEFKPDFYKDPLDKVYFSLDIIRLVISIIIALSAGRSFLNSQKLMKQKTIMNYFKIIVGPEMFIPIICLILYCISFSKKLAYLANDVDYLFQSISEYQYESKRNVDFYLQASAYEDIIRLESVIIFLLFIRLSLVVLESNERLKAFKEYLINCIESGSLFIFIAAFMIVNYSIFAHMLFGFTDDNFKDFLRSLNSLLLVCLGHSSLLTESLSNSYLNVEWKVLFITLFVLFFIYTFLSSFFGVFYMNYRIQRTREPSSYEKRPLTRLEKSKDEEVDAIKQT